MVRSALFIFYTDGSLIEGCAGFAVHQIGVGGFGHEILNSACVSTAELSALFTALRHIAEVIRFPKRCLILTDSWSSIKVMLSKKIAQQTSPLMYECKQLCRSLCQNRIEVKLMWARQTALEGSIIFERFPEFCKTGVGKSMAGKMRLCGYW
jgi:hypothetical protein